jgi:hypothetical protein
VCEVVKKCDEILRFTFRVCMRSGKVRVNSFTLLRRFQGGSDERVFVLLGTNTGDAVDVPMVGLDDR